LPNTSPFFIAHYDIIRPMPLPATLTRSKRSDGLRFADDSIEWTGLVDVDAESVVRWQWTIGADEQALAVRVRAGDPCAVDELTRRSVVPALLLDELAQRCCEKSLDSCIARVVGREIADTRWQRALTRATIALGKTSTSTPADAQPEVVLETKSKRTVSHVRILGDGTIVALEIPSWEKPRAETARVSLIAANGARQFLEFLAPEGLAFALPTPARADTNTLIVSAHDDQKRVAAFWHVEGGRVRRAWRCAVDSPPQEFSTTATGIWVHCARHHLFVDESCAFDAGNEPYGAPSGEARDSTRGMARGMDEREGRCLIMGEWLLVFSREVLREAPSTGWISERLSWVHLDENRESIRQPWNRKVGKLAVVDDALLSASDDGLFRATPSREAEQVRDGAFTSLDIDGSAIWVADWKCLHKLDLATMRELLAVEPGHLTFNVHPLRGGFIAREMSRWSWYDDAGAIRYRSDDRRDTGFARLADGTAACSAGEEVILFGPDGQIRRRTRLPFDGQIVGATDNWFVYGAVSGGLPRVDPDAMYAIDGDGRLVERLPTRFPRPLRTFYAGGSTGDGGAIGNDAVIVADGERLLRWRVCHTGDERRAVLTPSRRTERKATSVKGERVNPRDDWPEAGCTIFCEDFLAIGSKYGGTYGAVSDAAVTVDDGAVAVLVDCDVGQGGLKVKRGSSVVLVGCTIATASEWSLDARSHVALVDCKISAPFAIAGEKSSTVACTGLELVKLDDRRIRVQERNAPPPAPPPAVQPTQYEVQTRSVKPFCSKDGEYDPLLKFAWRVAPLAFPEFYARCEKLDEATTGDYGLSETKTRFGDAKQGFTVVAHNEMIDGGVPVSFDTVDVSVYGVDGALRLHSSRAPRDGERTRELTIEIASPRASEVLAEFEKEFDRRELPDDDLDALARQADRGIRFGQWQQALDAATRVLAQRPDDLHMTFASGVALAALGNLDLAEVSLDKCVAAKPDDYDAWYNIGVVRVQRGHTKNAIAAFRRVIAMDANNHPSWYQLGRALESEGQRDAAMDAYRAALRASPNPQGAFHYTGMDFTDAASNAIDRLKGRD
jgi:tetratricopeptide (TPR) repeat protein